MHVVGYTKVSQYITNCREYFVKICFDMVIVEKTINEVYMRYSDARTVCSENVYTLQKLRDYRCTQKNSATLQSKMRIII